MNSDARRILSHLNHDRDRDLHPPTYPPYYDAHGLPSRLTSSPTILVPVLVLIATVIYQIAAAQTTQLPPLSQLSWDIAVWLIPGRLLFALESWLNPPLFPTTMLQPSQVTAYTHAAKSDVLQRLIGTDHGGIMQSVTQAGRKSFSSLSGAGSTTKGSDQPPGLGNPDNSCYQNSILQGLAALTPLPSYLASTAVSRRTGRWRSKSTTSTTSDALRQLIENLNDGGNNGRTLWTPSILKNMSTWQQQDAQEYYSKLLDQIDKEIASIVCDSQKAAGFQKENSPGSSEDDGASSQHSDDSGYQSLSTVRSKAGTDGKTIRNPLEGLTAQRVACVTCHGSDGLSLLPFNCLTLDLGPQNQHNLYERLDSYAKLESIEGVDCNKCSLKKYHRILGNIVERLERDGKSQADHPEPYARLQLVEEALEDDDFSDDTLKRCKIPNRVASRKTKQTVIARPPQSLAIHINRSVFNENTGAMYKNLASVQFPMLLDLGPWCLGSAGALASEEGLEAEPTSDDEEQWILDPTKSMVAGNNGHSRISGPMYELRAVVTHQGRHENGHYVCYRRHARIADSDEDGSRIKPPMLAVEDEKSDHRHESPAQDPEGADDESEPSQWWRLSDQNVYRVDEETVLAQGGVFMLFYDLVDPITVLCSEAEDYDSKGQAQEESDVKEDVESSHDTASFEPETTPSPNDSQDTASASTVAEAESVRPAPES